MKPNKFHIDKLRFDPDNPRLPYNLDREDEATVLKWMLDDATLIELMGSIGEKGYFEGEPLLVVQSNKAGQFDVVEGNRRVAAVKLLSNPSKATIRKNAVQKASNEAQHKPQELPVLIFERRDEILEYLGYRHITGVKEWGPLAKARYLKQLYERTSGTTNAEKFQSLAKTIGSRSDYVARLLTGLNVYGEIAEENYFGIQGLNEATINFSLLTTALNYSNVVHFLDLSSATDPDIGSINKDNLKELTSWIFEKGPENRTRVGESRGLRELSAILENPRALKTFREGTPLAEAYLFTEGPSELFTQMLHEARSKLQTAQANIYMIEQHKQSDQDIIREIVQLVRTLRATVQAALSAKDDL